MIDSTRSTAAADKPRESDAAEIDAAVRQAADAADAWAASSADARISLLGALADALESARERLVPIADAETGLGPGRLNGELDRTAFQLRAFADAVRAGDPYRTIDDEAVAGAPPRGRPRLSRVRLPLGPVAMFSASNFPFAFSVLGGDTASALAAGCPVVVKAHPAHPQLSRAVFELACDAAARAGAPVGVLRMVEGASLEVGVALVRHPLVEAVAFTGSFKGGAALQAEANARPRPIPFFGELGSINPVVALPSALAARGAELATTLAASIAMGCGQFCTSPGVLVLLDDEASDAFVRQLTEAVQAQTTHRMLTVPMRRAFDAGIERLCAHPAVRRLALAHADDPAKGPAPCLLEADADAFMSDHVLREEIFGPSCVVLRVESVERIRDVLHAVAGSLTVTVWGADTEDDDTRTVVRAAMRIAGRVLFAGVPTGVAVTGAQQHGGPWPASTRPESTSVGLAALDRFLRPVALQDAPAWLVQRKGVPC